MVNTRPSNAHVHPGDMVNAYKQTRRTKKQILDAKVKAKAAAQASKEKAAAEYCAAIQRIAELEDKIGQTEKLTRTHTNRPDLHTSPEKPLQVPVGVRTTGSSSSHKPLQAKEGDEDLNEDSAHANHEPLQSREGDEDFQLEVDEDSASEEAGPQPNADALVLAGDNDDNPSPARSGECSNDAGPIQLSDQEGLLPTRHKVQKKKVSTHILVT